MSGPAGSLPPRRALLGGLAAVVLAVVAVIALTRGVDTRPVVGGLLAEPVPVTRVVGGWLAPGVAAGVAAVLAGVDAVAVTLAARARGTRRAPGPAGTLEG